MKRIIIGGLTALALLAVFAFFYRFAERQASSEAQPMPRNEKVLPTQEDTVEDTATATSHEAVKKIVGVMSTLGWVIFLGGGVMFPVGMGVYFAFLATKGLGNKPDWGKIVEEILTNGVVRVLFLGGLALWFSPTVLGWFIGGEEPKAVAKRSSSREPIVMHPNPPSALGGSDSRPDEATSPLPPPDDTARALPPPVVESPDPTPTPAPLAPPPPAPPRLALGSAIGELTPNGRTFYGFAKNGGTVRLYKPVGRFGIFPVGGKVAIATGMGTYTIGPGDRAVKIKLAPGSQITITPADTSAKGVETP